MLQVVAMETRRSESGPPEVDGSDDRGQRVVFVIPRTDFAQLERVATVRRSSVAALVREIVGAALDAGFASA